MTDFEVKAIETDINKKYRKLVSLNIRKKQTKHGDYFDAEIEIEIDGIVFNSGMYMSPDWEDNHSKIENKIDYTITTTRCVRDGLNNYEIMEENIRWQMKDSNGEVPRISNTFKEYCVALQNAAGGTWEGIIAFKMLKKAGYVIEVGEHRQYCEFPDVLRENIREKLNSINFYKKTKQKTRKTKIKRFIDKLLPKEKRKLINN